MQSTEPSSAVNGVMLPSKSTWLIFDQLRSVLIQLTPSASQTIDLPPPYRQSEPTLLLQERSGEQTSCKL